MNKKIGRMRSGLMFFAILLAIGLVFGQTTAWAAPPPAPVADAGADITISSAKVAVTTILGRTTNPNGDNLEYRWVKGSKELLTWGDVDAVELKCPLDLDILTPPPSGINTLTLEVRIVGQPDPISTDDMILTVDDIKPTLDPVADKTSLWPPNHKMVKVTIMANATDNSGEKPTLAATVSSDEPVNGDGDGNTSPDWENLTIDQTTGEITVWLRAERSGPGDGRVYTVHITATDLAENVSTSNVEVRVPHDQGDHALLWRNKSTGANALWYMDGSKFRNAKQLPSVNDQNWKIVGMADFDGDGQADILWSHKSGRNVVWHMNGASFRYASYLLTVTDTNWEAAGVADFNDDGNPDILWRNHANGSTAVWYMNGATFQGAEQLPTVTDTNWEIVGIADFDLDGHLDILWRNTATGASAVWHLRGANFSHASYLLSVTDKNWQMVGTDDYDDDNHPDILWRNTATGATVVWYMNGSNFRYSAQLPTVNDTDWEIVGP
jgi:hypothetical protein